MRKRRNIILDFISILFFVMVIFILLRLFRSTGRVDFVSPDIYNVPINSNHVFYEFKNNDGTFRNYVTILSDMEFAFPKDIIGLFEFENIPEGLTPRIKRISFNEIHVYLDGKTTENGSSSHMIRAKLHYKGDLGKYYVGAKVFPLLISFGNWQRFNRFGEASLKKQNSEIDFGAPFSLHTDSGNIYVASYFGEDTNKNTQILKLKMNANLEFKLVSILESREGRFFNLTGNQEQKYVVINFDSVDFKDKDFNLIKTIKKENVNIKYSRVDKLYYMYSQLTGEINQFDDTNYDLKKIQDGGMESIPSYFTHMEIGENDIFLTDHRRLNVYSKSMLMGVKESFIFDETIRSTFYDHDYKILYVLLPNVISVIKYSEGENKYEFLYNIETGIKNPRFIMGDDRWEHIYVIDGDTNEIVLFHYVSR